MFEINMWYDNKIEEVDKLDIIISGIDGMYRGNVFIKGKYVGDYVTDDSTLLEKKFPQLIFNWDVESEPMDICLTENMMDMLEKGTR